MALHSAGYQIASTSTFLPQNTSTSYYMSASSNSSAITMSPCYSSYLPDSKTTNYNQFAPFWHLNNNSSSSSDEASCFKSKFETTTSEQYFFKKAENENDEFMTFNFKKNAGKIKTNSMPNKYIF